MRVVSLVPSATETLLAWGIEPVAVTRFCEQPDLPQVGGTKDPDLAAIVALAPDLVVLCEEENRAADAEALVAAGLAVHVRAHRLGGRRGPPARARWPRPSGAAPPEPSGARPVPPTADASSGAGARAPSCPSGAARG